MESEWHKREVVQCIQTRGRKDGLIVSGTREERYLRGDISCGSAACANCRQDWPSLPADAEAYVIPDYQCLERYLDCFQEESFCDGVIILRSEIQKIGYGKIRLLSRLRNLYRDKRRHAYLFDDLHHEDVATLRRELPSALASAIWYWSHLSKTKRICVVIDDMEAYHKRFDAFLTKVKHNIEIISTGRYFQGRWSGYRDKTIWNLFEAIEEKIEEKKELRERESMQGAKVALANTLESGKYVQGILHVESGGRSRAVVEPRLIGSNDSKTRSGLNSIVHLVSQEHRGRAMHGDEVIVVIDRVENTELGGPASADSIQFSTIIENEGEIIETSGYDQDMHLLGKVVAVTRRQVSDLVVTICEKDKTALQSLPSQDGTMHSVICIPFDRRFPKMRLKSRGISRLLGKRLLVRFIEWRQASNYPEVHLIKVMGDIGDLKTETDLILLRHDLLFGDFNKDALREVPASSCKSIGNWVPSIDLINTEIKKGRLDLRHEFVVSVDPPGCTDVDDAFHLKELSEEAFEIGVHIADVSYFVRNNSLLDDEAAARCTTVYLVDRRLNMLPDSVSEDAASLLSNVTRFAVSIIWQISKKDFSTMGVWIGRTIIQSKYQLAYEQAQSILDGSRDTARCGVKSLHDLKFLERSFNVLRDLAFSRFKKRLSSGAIDLDSKELGFTTNKSTGAPEQIKIKTNIDMMKIIAEIMIFANQEAALKIHSVFPTSCLIRCHSPPEKKKLESLAVFLKNVEQMHTRTIPGDRRFFVDPQSFGKDLQALHSILENEGTKSLLKARANRALAEARYMQAGSTSSTNHFGLGLTMYTHFTSPIRRYSDIIVHRQLLEAIQSNGSHDNKSTMSDLDQKVTNMNTRNRASKLAQRECSLLYLLLLFHSKPQAEMAIVTSICRETMSVYIPRFEIQGNIQLAHRSQGESALEKDELPASSLAYLFPDTESITLHFSEEINGGFKKCSISSEASSTDIRLLSEIPVLLTAQVSAAHGPFLKIYILPEKDTRIDNKRIDPSSHAKKTSSMFRQENIAHSDLHLGNQIEVSTEPRIAPQQQDHTTSGVDNLTHSLSSLSIALENIRKDNKASVSKYISLSVPNPNQNTTITRDYDGATRSKMHTAARNLHHKASIYGKRSTMFEKDSPRYCYWKYLSDKARQHAMLLQALLIGADSSTDITLE